MAYPSRSWTGTVDVSSEVVIARPRGLVAAFAVDPRNAPAWHVNLETIEWRSEPPLRVGSRVAFVATFLGHRLAYTYEVDAYEPDALIVMRTTEGPFPMETSYAWTSTERDGTRMVLRHRGRPGGFAGLVAPVVTATLRRAGRADLLRLKAVLERPGTLRRVRPAPAAGDPRDPAPVVLAEVGGSEVPIERRA